MDDDFLQRTKGTFLLTENRIDILFTLESSSHRKRILLSIREDFYFSYNSFIVRFLFFWSLKFEGSFTVFARDNVFKIIPCPVCWNIRFNYYVEREFSSRQLRRVGALFNFRLVTQT